jgi:hypothetical protein
MTTITICEARPDEIEALIPILRQAEETEGALRWSPANLEDPVTWAIQLSERRHVVEAAPAGPQAEIHSTRHDYTEITK